MPRIMGTCYKHSLHATTVHRGMVKLFRPRPPPSLSSGPLGRAPQEYRELGKAQQSTSILMMAGPSSAVLRTLLMYPADLGAFSADMTKAVQNGSFQSSTRTLPNNNLVVLHAALLGGSFGIGMPLAVIFLRLSRLGFRPHWIVQSLALAASLVGVAVAIYMSIASTSFKSISQAHQIIGIVVVMLLIPQALLGRVHHVNFKRTKQRSVVSHFHLWIGRGVIPLGMLNGVL